MTLEVAWFSLNPFLSDLDDFDNMSASLVMTV